VLFELSTMWLRFCAECRTKVGQRRKTIRGKQLYQGTFAFKANRSGWSFSATRNSLWAFEAIGAGVTLGFGPLTIESAVADTLPGGRVHCIALRRKIRRWQVSK